MRDPPTLDAGGSPRYSADKKKAAPLPPLPTQPRNLPEAGKPWGIQNPEEGERAFFLSAPGNLPGRILGGRSSNRKEGEGAFLLSALSAHHHRKRTVAT